MPMTVPVLMAGVRVSMVMIVGIAAIAKLIGVLCLGKFIFDGIGRASDPMVIAGAVGVSVFALLVDALLGWAQTRLTPTGLREQPAG
jgi:osmoprotectant transport system permease protein